MEGPSESLPVLGIALDTWSMEAANKLKRIVTLVLPWLTKKKLGDIISFVGLLQHATKIVKSGRTFYSKDVHHCSQGKEATYLIVQGSQRNSDQNSSGGIRMSLTK